MKLEQYRDLWCVLDNNGGIEAGSDYHKFMDVIPDIAKLGFDGIEIPLKMILQLEQQHHEGWFVETMREYGLKYTVMVFTDGPMCCGENGWLDGPYEGFTLATPQGTRCKKTLVDTHLALFKEQVTKAYEYGAQLVVAHTGRDFFTTEMAKELFTEVVKFEKETGYVVCHETHRQRVLYSPWVVRDLLPFFPDLKLTGDFSHFVICAEVQMDDLDLTQLIEDVAPQVWHMHCRIACERAMYVPDPRAPEYLSYMECHERWWDAVWRAQQARGQEVTTMKSDQSYPQLAAFTGRPLVDLWDVNHWIHMRRQARFAELFGASNTSKVQGTERQGAEPSTCPGPSILTERVGIPNGLVAE